MPIVKTDVYDVQAPFALDLRLVKSDMNARDAIGTFQRYVGMTVFVLNDNTFWQLQGGTTNDDWVEVDGSSGIVMQSVVVNAAEPTGGNEGDIWFRQQGNVVSVYQNVDPAGWTALGDLVMGDTPTLQEVTDEGNTTNNPLVVTGNSLPAPTSSRTIALHRYTLYGAVTNFDFNGDPISALRMFNDGSVSLNGGPVLNSASSTKLTLSIDEGAFLTSGGFPNILKPLTLADAVNDDHAVTKRQLDAVAPTYTYDPSTPNTSALSYLNTTYPNAKPGDQVYKTDGGSRRTWTCYAAGEWSRIDEVIET